MRPFTCLIAVALLIAIGSLLPAKAQGTGDGMVYVFRYIEASADAQNKVPTLLKQLAEVSRKEAGAMGFEVLRRPDPSSQFLAVEVWKDQKAFEAHMAAAHTKQFAAQIEPLLIAPIDSRLCFALEAAAPSFQPVSGANVVAVTHVDVNPPGKEETDGLLKDMVTVSRKDAGNVRFDAVVQNGGRFNHYQVLEIWASQKADDEHEAATHTKQFRGKLAPLNGALYDQRFYKAL
jgi:quinol monooxygenase YgiN